MIHELRFLKKEVINLKLCRSLRVAFLKKKLIIHTKNALGESVSVQNFFEQKFEVCFSVFCLLLFLGVVQW